MAVVLVVRQIKPAHLAFSAYYNTVITHTELLTLSLQRRPQVYIP